MAAGIGPFGVDAADSSSAWLCILLSRDQCLCEGSAMAAGIGSSGGDAADLCSAWRLFLLSRDHCL